MKLKFGLLQVLRRTKSELKERAKNLRYYGVSGIAVNNLHPLRFLSDDNQHGLIKTIEEKFHEYQITEELKERLNQIRMLNNMPEKLFSELTEVTFISFTIPRINSTSSEFRLFHILKILLQNNCKIDFIYCTKLLKDNEYIEQFVGNIRFLHLPLNPDNYINYIYKIKPEYVWITELWRLNFTKFMAEHINRLKARCPISTIIVDTVDFHYKEFYRKYELTKENADLKRAKEFLEYEKTLYKAANVVVVISDDEKRDIEEKISGIKRLEVVPNIHEIKLNSKPFHIRKNICFVGHFGNKHNVDAVTLFIRDIWPSILSKNHKAEFHVIGFHSERYKREFMSQNVKVIGGLKYLENAMTNYRLFVCPMTYGAGMKGKIGGAIAVGLPVVTSSIGAEGYSLNNGEEWYIADNPTDFADKCHICLNDPVVWNRFRENSLLYAYKNLSSAAVRYKLEKVFSGE